MTTPRTEIMGNSGTIKTQLYRPPILLSVLPASTANRRMALIVSMLLAAGFLAVLPFARIRAERLPAFVVAQQSMLAVSDMITALLLFGQYSIGRSRGLNILASGYLFTALIVIPHM